MNESFDRRGSGRVSHEDSVLVRANSDTFQRGQSLDFNESGARLVVPNQVEAGASVAVHLRLGAQRFLSLLATVVWAKPDNGGAATEVGVRFQHTSPSTYRNFSSWLHGRRLQAAYALS